SWSGCDFHRHGDVVRHGHTHRDGHVSGCHHYVGHGHAERRDRDVHHFGTRDRNAFHHRNLRRRCELYRQHFADPDADDWQGGELHCRRLVEQSVHYWNGCDSHRHGDFAGHRHTHWDGHVSGRHLCAGHGHAERRSSDVHHFGADSRSAFDHRSLRRRCELRQQHFARPDANGGGLLPFSVPDRRGGHGRIDINVRHHHHSPGRIQPADFVSVQRRSDVGCL